MSTPGARATPLVPACARRLPAAGAIAAILIALAGCGKSASEQQSAGGVETVVIHTGAAGTAATATRNTTRLGGSGRRGRRRRGFPRGLPRPDRCTRPQAVVIAGAHDWPAALAACSLASAPLGAPLLYSEG